MSSKIAWRFERNITVPNEKILKRMAKILKVTVSEITNNNRKDSK
jgi:ribosome-binding protein aMBF1 (putative translation factor)